VQGVLESSQAFLARVASTGPLWSLLNAASLRDDFVRIHRDLSSAFTIMGAGESLVVSVVIQLLFIAMCLEHDGQHDGVGFIRA
jgi:hypothetical protein